MGKTKKEFMFDGVTEEHLEEILWMDRCNDGQQLLEVDYERFNLFGLLA